MILSFRVSLSIIGHQQSTYHDELYYLFQNRLCQNAYHRFQPPNNTMPWFHHYDRFGIFIMIKRHLMYDFIWWFLCHFWLICSPPANTTIIQGLITTAAATTLWCVSSYYFCSFLIYEKWQYVKFTQQISSLIESYLILSRLYRFPSKQLYLSSSPHFTFISTE